MPMLMLLLLQQTDGSIRFGFFFFWGGGGMKNNNMHRAPGCCCRRKGKTPPMTSSSKDQHCVVRVVRVHVRSCRCRRLTFAWCLLAICTKLEREHVVDGHSHGIVRRTGHRHTTQPGRAQEPTHLYRLRNRVSAGNSQVQRTMHYIVRRPSTR